MTDNRILNEIEHGKFIAQDNESYWGWSSDAGKKRFERRCNLFIDFIGNDNSKILEIGCGTGTFTQHITKTKNNFTCIDISQELLDIASNKINHDNVTFLLENAYNTKFQDNSFDFIVGSSVLHHLELDKALQEFYRILKPGGKIFFTEPNMLNPQIMLQKNIPLLKKMAGDSPDETAFIRFLLTKKLNKNNFKNITTIPFDFLHPAIPSNAISLVSKIQSIAEKTPLVKEIAGSLIISAQKS